jgi:predicted oxidoreductase (fatty acid repression mutant protein)
MPRAWSKEESAMRNLSRWHMNRERTGRILQRGEHISPEAVMRDWKLAKAWLLREPAGPHGAGA